MEGFLIREWGLTLDGARSTNPSQSAISQRGCGVSTLRGGIGPGDHCFRPRFGVVGVYKDFDPGMGPYPPRIALAPRTPANQRSTSGSEIPTPYVAVSTLVITVFVPGLLEL